MAGPDILGMVCSIVSWWICLRLGLVAVLYLLPKGDPARVDVMALIPSQRTVNERGIGISCFIFSSFLYSSKKREG